MLAKWTKVFLHNSHLTDYIFMPDRHGGEQGELNSLTISVLIRTFVTVLQFFIAFLFVYVCPSTAISSGPGSGPCRGHCVVFLGKTLCSHGASLHPGV